MAAKVGFIGPGLMGHGIAKNIVEKGHDLQVLAHRNRAPVDDLVSRGAREGACARALAGWADVVVLCLPSSREVEAVMHGEDGLLAGARHGLIVVDTTTAEPASTEALLPLLRERGVLYADAPLTRSPKDAEAGRLNTLVGSDEALFSRIRPLLETFCENIFFIGPVMSGQKMKLINNFIVQGTAAILAEACTTAVRGGVSLERLYDVVSEGGANSSVFQRMMPWVLGTGPGGMVFQLKNAQKDVRYYTHMAEALGSTAFVGEAVHQTFVLAAGQGEGDNHVPALARALGKINGVKIGPADG